MSTGEFFEPYKFRQIVDFEQWRKTVVSLMELQLQSLRKYRGLYNGATEQSKKKVYVEKMRVFGKVLKSNLDLLETAELENDSLLFYFEDGMPTYHRVLPGERQQIMSAEMARKRIVV